MILTVCQQTNKRVALRQSYNLARCDPVSAPTPAWTSPRPPDPEGWAVRLTDRPFGSNNFDLLGTDVFGSDWQSFVIQKWLELRLCPPEVGPSHRFILSFPGWMTETDFIEAHLLSQYSLCVHYSVHHYNPGSIRGNRLEANLIYYKLLTSPLKGI